MEKIDARLYAEIKELLSEIPIDFGGGCSFEKGYMMAWLIANFNLKVSVDIGVYRGRSLFPQAIAHARFSRGIVYGIDPWDVELARLYDNTAARKEINDFLDNTDLNAISMDVDRLNKERDFIAHCVLIRKKSEDAISQFKEGMIKFGLIHIDGNHDIAMVLRDVELYLPLLADKGFVVMDDISWDSVRPAFDIVCSKYNLIYKTTDRKYATQPNDYAIFWNNTDEKEVDQINSALEEIGHIFQINDLEEGLARQIAYCSNLNNQLQEQITCNTSLNSQLQELSVYINGMVNQVREQSENNERLQS